MGGKRKLGQKKLVRPADAHTIRFLWGPKEAGSRKPAKFALPTVVCPTLAEGCGLSLFPLPPLPVYFRFPRPNDLSRDQPGGADSLANLQNEYFFFRQEN